MSRWAALMFWSTTLRAATGFAPARPAAWRTAMVARPSPSTVTMMSTATPEATGAEAAGQEAEAIVLPTNDNSDTLLRIRHTSAHVMAMAVQKLFPDVQVTIGPWIDNGFYYDFFKEGDQFSESDLKGIKKEMQKIIKKKLPLVRPTGDALPPPLPPSIASAHSVPGTPSADP